MFRMERSKKMDNKKELLLKLQELAKRGVNGEKENADKLLKKLMKKYNISEDEINDEEINEVELELKDDIEVRLACQILFSFFDNAPLYKKWKKRVKYYTKLTKPQEIEFRYMFSVYLENFRKQELIFYRAFINKNRIFPKEILNKKGRNPYDISPEERAEILKSQMMMEGIEMTRIRKALKGEK